MKKWISALLLVVGFTVMGRADATLGATIAICIGKISLIALGGMMLISELEKEDADR